MKNEFPKVLIVNSQSMKANNATGITLRSLWTGWPKECMLELVEDSVIENCNDFSLNSIVLPSKCTPLKKILLSKIGKKINQRIKKNGVAHAQGPSDIKKRIRQNIVYLADLSPVKIDFQTKQKVIDFDPDVIYTLGGSVVTLKLSSQLAKELRLPIVVHFMDNWLECLQENDLIISKFYLNLLVSSLNKCLKFSNICIAISEEMALTYAKKLNLEFSTLMNSVDVSGLTKIESLDYHPIINFVYAGGLHLER